MKNPYIKSILFTGEHRKNSRKIKVKLSSGSTVIIEACYESWEQYGGTRAELFITMPIAERYNEWLHGGERP